MESAASWGEDVAPPSGAALRVAWDKMHPLNHLARMHACLFGAAATQRQPRNTRQHLEDSSNAMSCGVGDDALFRSEASITGTTRAARTRMLAATFHAP